MLWGGPRGAGPLPAVPHPQVPARVLSSPSPPGSTAVHSLTWSKWPRRALGPRACSVHLWCHCHIGAESTWHVWCGVVPRSLNPCASPRQACQDSLASLSMGPSRAHPWVRWGKRAGGWGLGPCLTLSFLRALNFFRHSTVSCLCIMEATVDRCCGKRGVSFAPEASREEGQGEGQQGAICSCCCLGPRTSPLTACPPLLQPQPSWLVLVCLCAPSPHTWDRASMPPEPRPPRGGGLCGAQQTRGSAGARGPQGKLARSTYTDPRVLQCLMGGNALGGVDGQHLIDEVFGFRSDCVPLRGWKLESKQHVTESEASFPGRSPKFLRGVIWVKILGGRWCHLSPAPPDRAGSQHSRRRLPP